MENILTRNKEKQEFQEEITDNAVKCFELLRRVGTANTEIVGDRAGANIIEGWEQKVKTIIFQVTRKG